MLQLWQQALEDALKKMQRNILRFGGLFPDAGENGLYTLNANASWTGGFWSGMLWMAYQYSGDGVYLNAARLTVDSFRRRMADRIHLDHHDIGFLYSLSAKAQWMAEGDPAARQLALEAADMLMLRWRPKARLIQSWGAEEHPVNGGRIIMDSLMNMPLLYWASGQTGDPRYQDAAIAHTDKSRKFLVRGDDSSFHTFRFNPETGQPIGGSTHQGYSDGSTWTRGQAWGVYGFALAYRYTGNAGYLETAKRLALYFLDHLPEDHVAYWDFDAPLAPDPPRDSSASAISACGMLELLTLLPADDPARTAIAQGAERTMQNLVELYSTIHQPESEGLIQHGSYSVPKGRNTDSFLIWGDYYYLEALLRLEKGLHGFWYES